MCQIGWFARVPFAYLVTVNHAEPPDPYHQYFHPLPPTSTTFPSPFLFIRLDTACNIVGPTARPHSERVTTGSIPTHCMMPWLYTLDYISAPQIFRANIQACVFFLLSSFWLFTRCDWATQMGYEIVHSEKIFGRKINQNEIIWLDGFARFGLWCQLRTGYLYKGWQARGLA